MTSLCSLQQQQQQQQPPPPPSNEGGDDDDDSCPSCMEDKYIEQKCFFQRFAFVATT